MEFTGLSSKAAEEYIKAHGYNEIIEHKESLALKLLHRSATPISGMLLAAAILSLAAGKDFDFFFILFLLVLNVAITIWQEQKADTAVQKLNEHLSISVKARRDSAWRSTPSRELVPHDVIRLQAGDIIPADGEIKAATSISTNEAALTGESLPKDKGVGDTVCSGSFIASGLSTIEVTATGNRTYFGKTLAVVETTRRVSSMEKNIYRISRFLTLLSLSAVAILSAVLILRHAETLEVLRLDLSLIIAGIPISLPTVMTLIIALGVVELAKKKVVVRRLSALEDLANTDLLLTDKTGTLTKNEIVVGSVIPYGRYSEDEVMRHATAAASSEPDTAIGSAILKKSDSFNLAPILAFTPADSTRKHSTTKLKSESGIETLSLGAPQVILPLCEMSEESRTRFLADTEELASRGYRALALSRVKGDKEMRMEMVGILSISDELREDAAETIQYLTENGVGVVMLTGDNRAIAREVAHALNIPGSTVVGKDGLERMLDQPTAKMFDDTQAFAEILPEDKYALVKAAKRFFTVAANGDGVNDLPAIREADVGFAVKNAVDALRGAADIVLLSDGITVMRDAFIEGRKIFARLYTYSIYRISESFRLIVTICILGLWIGAFPLSPLQLILLALLNDIPIITLAFDHVRVAHKPATINVREQFGSSLVFGMIGVGNSILLFALATYLLHLPSGIVQTLFFLKLTISGHLLIYNVHTPERWWRALPSKQIIWATSVTQAIATLLAVTGYLMPAPISWKLALFVWAWAFLFMQMSELAKAWRASPASVTA